MEENYYRQDNSMQYIVNIKVVGVGGGGNNAVHHMMKQGLKGVEFYAANTDSQSLLSFDEDDRMYIGQKLTKGLGAGADPEIGRKAAEESADSIRQTLAGADMVFIAAGMGGGTGTGAAPVIAKIAKELGALTIAIVTTPFGFEGAKRRTFASEGLQELRPNVDSLIVISNETLLQMFGNVSIRDSFKKADDILWQSVHAITSLINEKALINLDFADVRNIMKDKGTAMIGMGRGVGETKARDAATQAFASPLLGSTIKGAKNAIVNITGGAGITLQDANEAVEIVREAAGDNINIIFGIAIDEQNLENSNEDQDYMKVTVIATEFSSVSQPRSGLENNFRNEAINELPKVNIFSTPIQEPTFEETPSFIENVDEDKDSSDFDFAIPSFLRKK